MNTNNVQFIYFAVTFTKDGKEQTVNSLTTSEDQARKNVIQAHEITPTAIISVNKIKDL